MIGMPPIAATEKNPVRVCSDLSAGVHDWIAVWVETDNTETAVPGRWQSETAARRRTS